MATKQEMLEDTENNLLWRVYLNRIRTIQSRFRTVIIRRVKEAENSQDFVKALRIIKAAAESLNG